MWSGEWLSACCRKLLCLSPQIVTPEDGFSGFLHTLFIRLKNSSYCPPPPAYLYFYCYAVHVVELLNYYTNHCTYRVFHDFRA